MPRSHLLDFFDGFAALRAPFVIHDDGYRARQASYREISASAHTCAARLGAVGVGPGDKVVIWSENRIEWVVALWGVLLARAVIVPVDFQSSPALVTRIASIVSARVILIGNDVQPPAGAAAAIYKLTELAGITDFASPPAASEPAPGDLAEILFTSGTTGDPKGVTITHRNILANVVPIEREAAKWLAYLRPFLPLRFLNLLPLSHMFGQSLATFVPPILRSTVVFTHGYTPAEIVRQIRSRKVNVLVVVPKVLDVLREHVQRVAPASVEADVLAGRHWLRRWWRYRDVHRLFGWRFCAVVVGAAPLEPELETFWRKLGFLVIQGYGLTEAAPIVTMNHPLRTAAGSVGTPIEGVEIRIAEDGEILVRGENVSAGYFQPEGPYDLQPRGATDGWLHTGDVGELDARGQLVIRGRKKEMIVTAQGLNVFPQDVEKVVAAIAGVREVAVVGVRVGSEERVHAVLVVDPAADLDAIVQAANAGLEPHQKIWRGARWPAATLPRTDGTRKLKRRELQQWVSGQTAPAGAPQGATVEAIVSRLAGGREVSAEQTLDALGLSSLDRIELMMALESAFHITLDEVAVAAGASIADLKVMVRAADPTVQPMVASTAPSRAGSAAPSIVFPAWNRSWWARFARRISLPTWILPVARAFMQLEVVGRQHLAGIEGPVLFASNHQSHMDTPAILAALPPRWRYRVAPAMAKEFFAAHFRMKPATTGQRRMNTMWYYLASLFFNAFPLPQREAGARQTLRYIGEILSGGDSVLIFPEGKRTEHGELGPFRPGVGMMASRLDALVVPVRVDGLHRVLHTAMRYPKRGPVRVAFGAPLRLEGDDFQGLALRVRAAIEALES